MSPISVESRHIEGLAVTLLGPKDAAPVLLSPGLGGLGGYWRLQSDFLAKRYRVILYDHRGTGASDRPLPTPYHSAHLGEDIRLILDGLGIAQAHIIGHAAGAVAGLSLALDHPEKVASLCVINGWAVADAYFKRCFEIRTRILRDQGAEAYLRAQPLFLFPADWIAEHLDELDAQAAHHAPDFQDEPTLLARIAALAGFDIRDRLERIRCPVLALVSADDMLVPSRSGKDLARGLPQARLVLLPRGGHAVNVTEAEQVNDHLLQFLASVAAPPLRTGR